MAVGVSTSDSLLPSNEKRTHVRWANASLNEMSAKLGLIGRPIYNKHCFLYLEGQLGYVHPVAGESFALRKSRQRVVAN